MEIKECDRVETIYDKSFDNGFVPRGTVGYVMVITKANGLNHYLLEINSINQDDPLFDFLENEIKLNN